MSRHFLPICLCVLAVSAAGCKQKDPLEPEEKPAAADVPVSAKENPALLQQPAEIGPPDGGVVADYEQRLREFIRLRDELEGRVGAVPEKATPQQIDDRQRALAAEVAKARAGAKAGDIFVPGMQKYIRAVVQRVVTGPDGGTIKASLMDENPMDVKVAVNQRYPDTIPMSTMPPDVLAALPELPDDLEYRFLGNRLILLDVRSHLVIDFVEHTFDE